MSENESVMLETETLKAFTPKTYLINEIFYSIQGEGIRAGTPMVFVRFSKCNMACTVEPGDKSPGGFDCDTEFESGRRVTLDELDEWVDFVVDEVSDNKPSWLLLTGGEPALQVDKEFCSHYHGLGWKLAVETNGSMRLVGCEVEPDEQETLLHYAFDHICVSPKVAEHAIRQRFAHEVKYVRNYGMAIPKTVVVADHYLISPATYGMEFNSRDVQWCVDLVKQNPQWRLTTQLHKLWKVR